MKENPKGENSLIYDPCMPLEPHNTTRGKTSAASSLQTVKVVSLTLIGGVPLPRYDHLQQAGHQQEIPTFVPRLLVSSPS